MKKQTTSLALTIQAKKVLEDTALGDSIAVNGACLTVTKLTANTFDVDVMPETFNTTSLRQLVVGSAVQLERAIAANGRFGGHFVSGHIDAVAVIKKKEYRENALYMTIEVPEAYESFLLVKGSIAVDGTSLTIFHVVKSTITISLIPHTQNATILAAKNVGELVNIECDLLMKYVQQFIKPQQKAEKGMTQLLEESGFLSR
nr:riboflavin synthase [Bacillus chungangensis]